MIIKSGRLGMRWQQLLYVSQLLPDFRRAAIHSASVVSALSCHSGQVWVFDDSASAIKSVWTGTAYCSFGTAAA